MRIELAYISPRRSRLKSAPAQALVEDYVARAGRYLPCTLLAYDTEAALLASLVRGGRTSAHLVLLDSRGKAFTSEQWARELGTLRDNDVQHLLCAIGPADGWTPAAAQHARLRLSLGAMTLPHELALVLLAEQVYRALSILAGHPYHTGHG